MSVTGKRGVGIPIILLHDSEGGVVTVELKNGSIYRGILEDGQDNMNCTLKVNGLSNIRIFLLSKSSPQNCVKIDTTGKESKVELAYVRGSQINFIVLPDQLQNAPFFNRIKMWRKFRGHAQYGANTAAVNEMGMGRGRGGGFGGITPMMKRPRLDGPPNMGQTHFQPPHQGGGYGAPAMNQQYGQQQQQPNRFPPPQQQSGPYSAYGR